MYPETRMRRNRQTDALRRLAQTTRLSRDDLILPLFVIPGRRRREEIPALPGVYRWTADLLGELVAELPVPAVLLFGLVNADQKDDQGSVALRDDGPVPTAIRAIKAARPDLAVITDVCLCAYTAHGHCGLLTDDGQVDNDRTLPGLARMAAAHAAAGADMVAPSAMMDGQVAAIRAALDQAGLTNTGILSYAVKFASAFYGPFREAARSAPSAGDRRGYQLPPSDADAALREALLDEAEGADWLMVKPALPYLDIVAAVRRASRLPLAAYQVSGEYAMLAHAAQNGAVDERAAVLESLLAVKRAGANAIITYYAQKVSQWI